MHDVIPSAYAIQILLGAGIMASAAFYIVGYYSARDFFRQAYRGNGHDRDAGPPPGVTILKPLKGLDVDLYENLASFCRQDYPNFQIVFGVADADDPAVRVVRRLQADFPHLRLDLVIDGRVYGTNYKISNLHNMYRRAAHGIIVIADSDIRVTSDYLRRIVAELDDPKVGLVTCLYRGVNTGGLPTFLETLFINTDFALMVLVARIIENPTYAFGATMALRRSVLNEIGGFLPVANYLADDYQIGHRVAARGYRLALSDLVVETVLSVDSWRRLLDHQLRWARTYRNCRPGGYFGSIFTHGTLWATLNLLYNHFSPVACIVAAVVYMLRLNTTRIIDNRYVPAPVRFFEALVVLIKDLLVSGIWALCFLGDTVRWSGHEFRVLKDGQMVHVSPPAVPEPLVTSYSAPEERNRHAASI